MSSFNFNDETLYKDKYLKYKNKYINLKEQLGGLGLPKDHSIIFFNKDDIPELEKIAKEFTSFIDNFNNILSLSKPSYETEKKKFTNIFISDDVINGIPNIFIYTKSIKPSTIKPYMKLNFNNQYDAINKLNTSAGVNTVHNSKNVNSLITNYNNIEIASNEINLEYNIKNIKNFYTILNNESTIKQINDQFKKIYDVTIGLFISVSKKTQIPSTMLRGYDNDTCKLNNVNAFIIVTNLRYNSR